MYVLVLFAISLSLDAAAVGFSYGVKGIRMPVMSLLAMFVISALMSAAGILFGSIISPLFGPNMARWLSFLLLLGLGIWMLIDSFREAKEKPSLKAVPQEKTFEFVLRSIGLSVKIIRHPIDCDFDKSCVIDPLEAAYLAFLLSVDAVCSCASLAVGGAGSYITPLLTGAFQTVFLFAGDFAGKRIRGVKLLHTKIAMFLPGIILICVALLRFFG